ncbi:MAG: TonB-dependent receptor [Betaproteobacteria bacterium]|nr:TonB-dependent receptor [Betaproteobacteria bacterium]
MEIHTRVPRPDFKLLTLASLITTALGAYAQTPSRDNDKPAPIQRVEVTGSNIKRISTEGPSPIQVITRADIEQSGVVSVAELLDTVVANNNAGGQYRTNNTNNAVVGGAGISLRGLGPNSTLVLLNGRRMAPYGFSEQASFVDLNSIPLSAIERVEIVKDGASAIYGSDALAGVVNFILRKEYTGADLRVSAGRSQSYGDNDNQTVSLTAGSSVGRLKLLGILEAYNASAVQVSDRKGGKEGERTAAALAAGYTNAYLYEGAGIGSSFPSTSSSNGNLYSNNPANGGKQEYYAAGACNPPNVLYSGTFNGYAATKMCIDPVVDRYNTLDPKTRKLSGIGRATYEISPTLSAFGELSYSGIEQTYDFWPVFKNEYYDTSTTPNFPLALAPAGWAYYGRLYDELGKKLRDVTSRSTRAVAGLKGELANWDWEIGLMHAQTRTDFLGTNFIKVPTWNSGIADGSINPFKPLTAANIAALKTITTRNGKNSFTQLDGTASSQVGQLDAGPVMLALGANVRNESVSDGIDAASNAGLVENVARRLPISASRQSDAIYAELSVPFIKTIETQLALRRDHFSGVGSSVNPKLAIKWTPSTAFALRGSYSTGFRAPSLAEMNGGSRAPANCPTTNPFCPAPNQVWGTEVMVTFGGNPDLKPEKSSSTSVGMLWEPVKNHSIGIDIWSIERTNQVYAPDISNPADSAFFTKLSDATNAANAAFQAKYVNLGKTLVQGVDIGLQNHWSLGEMGKLKFALNSSNMSKYDTEYLGVTTGKAGKYGYPKWRHRADLGWAKAAWTTSLAANYRGEFEQLYTGPNNMVIMVKSFTTYDLYTAYKGLGHGVTLSGGILNLLGTAPPFDAAGRLGTLYEDNSNRRSIYVTLDYKF